VGGVCAGKYINNKSVWLRRARCRFSHFLLLGQQPLLEFGKPAFFCLSLDSARLKKNFVFFEEEGLDLVCHARQSKDGPRGGQVVEKPVYSFQPFLAAIYKE